jgi:hypothetical protein
MKYLFKIGALLGFGFTFVSPLLVWNEVIDLELNNTLMLVGTIIWFASAPLVSKKKEVN